MGIGSPLSINNIVILVNIETENISALEPHSSSKNFVPSMLGGGGSLCFFFFFSFSGGGESATCLRELGQATLSLIDFLHPILGSGDPPLQNVLEG